MDGLGEFEYEPLESQKPTFRLLRLLKREGPIIECELFEATLEPGQCDPYEALSYSWGSDERVEEVVVNGRVHWVTDNLHAALQNLQYCDSDRLLWIDGICIDQSNNDEKSLQVRAMEHIYRHANRVIIWLGKATKAVRTLTKLLQNTATSESRKNFESGDCPGTPTASQDLQQAEVGLRTLFGRPWFTRVWILQEVAFAKDALICAGLEEIPAFAFATAPSLFPKIDVTDHVQSVLDIMPGRALNSSWWHDKPDLFSLLRRFRDRKATDQRDMLYALLSLSSNSNDRANIIENYGIPVHEVVQSAMDYFMELPTTHIHEILDLLTAFTSITALLIIFADTRQNTMEIFGRDWEQEGLSASSTLSSRKDRYDCISRTRLRLIIERSGDSRQEMTSTCYGQALQLLNADVKTFYEERRLTGHLYDLGREPVEEVTMPIAVCPWEETQGNVKLLLVEDSSESLAITTSYELDMIVKLILGQGEVDPKGSARTEALVRATERRSASIMSLLLTAGVDLDAHHLFSEKEVQRLGMFRDTLLETRKSLAMTALGLASLRGDVLIAQALLESGANANALNTSIDISNLNYSNRPATALQMASAAKKNQVPMVELLLNHGANPNVSQGPLRRPLTEAARCGHDILVRTLIDHGADLEATESHYKKRDQHTAVFYAASHGYLSTTKLLFSVDSSRNDHAKAHDLLWGSVTGLIQHTIDRIRVGACHSNTSYVDIIMFFLANCPTFGDSARFDDLYTVALQAASLNGEADLLEHILRKGTPPDSELDKARKIRYVEAHGHRLMHLSSALQAAAFSGHARLAQILLDNGAAIDAIAGKTGTALCAAVRGGYVHMVDLLLERKANPNSSGTNGNALQMACDSLNGYSNGMIRTLLVHGADPNTETGDDDKQPMFKTPLQSLSRYDYEGKIADTIPLLIEYGADVDLESATGTYRTALHAASGSDNTVAIDQLVKHGASVNLVSSGSRHRTALQIAISKRSFGAIHRLIQHGADVNLWNEGEGHHTALQAAFVPDDAFNLFHEDVVICLIEYGAYLDEALELAVYYRVFDEVTKGLKRIRPRISEFPVFWHEDSEHRIPQQVSEWPMMLREPSMTEGGRRYSF